jgi:hypothetical protein
MVLGPKVKIGLGLFVVVALLAGWQGLRFWWYHGYSTGERTGTVRKLSVKGQNVEVWTFSVDDHGDANPIMKQLREAERTGARVTLHYRQDLKSWWRCQPNEYFITQVEK